jgi:hypothetical protein
MEKFTITRMFDASWVWNARPLRSRTDTEILLLAWERWGTAALAHLVGQWAFAIFDKVERRLWLARDPVTALTRCPYIITPWALMALGIWCERVVPC